MMINDFSVNGQVHQSFNESGKKGKEIKVDAMILRTFPSPGVPVMNSLWRSMVTTACDERERKPRMIGQRIDF